MHLVPVELCAQLSLWPHTPSPFNAIAHFHKNKRFGSQSVQGSLVIDKNVRVMKSLVMETT